MDHSRDTRESVPIQKPVRKNLENIKSCIVYIYILSNMSEVGWGRENLEERKRYEEQSIQIQAYLHE
jgi:hypothetical protein